MPTVEAFIGKIVAQILQPLVYLMFAVALLFFIWGLATFILKADEPKERETGRRHMIWGLIGLFIMVAVVSILGVVTATFCDTAFCK